MLISKNWLEDFVKLNVSIEVMCEKLTELGLEVESLEKAAPDFSGVVVGRVVELEQHPDADKLRVAKVDIGTEENLQIVCGAPNVAVDLIVPVASVGAVLPGDFKIKKSKLRGVESFGMLCSESELGLADDTSGLMSLPNTMSIGLDIREALGLNDEIIEIGLTPNRGDCLSMLGVARELSVAFDTSLTCEFSDKVKRVGNSPDVTLTALDACPQYIAQKISGISNNVESPLWLVERLRRAGIRSLSPVVDVTNYVMIELGTPLHAFDASKVEGGISVRMAHPKEPFNLLDGKEVLLDSDMLVIADDEKALALAGVMGGENSAVDITTSDIVLESAWFAPSAIIGRARRLTLHTDASHRFERGVDYRLQSLALERATQLIIDVCGGQSHEPTSKYEEKYLPKQSPISLSTDHIDAVLGFEFPKDQILRILNQLGMDVVANEDKSFEITAPSYRFDITIAEDLIEELARVWGYDKVPVANVVTRQLENQARQDFSARRDLNSLLVDMGYNEAITYSFIDNKHAQALSDTENTIELMNPLSAEYSVMRTSLLPSLTKVLAHNLNRQQLNVRLYEFGHGYNKIEGNIQQTEKVAGVVAGDVHLLQWGLRSRKTDFFDVKGDIEQMFNKLGVLEDISYKRSQREFLHPGQSADVFYQGECIGFVGTLHPNVQKTIDISARTLAFELDIAKITQVKLPEVKCISKYPEVRRDISVLMAQGHQSSDIIDTISGVSNELVTDVKLFDVYIGRNIPRNTKSMAIAIYLQDEDKTLTDEQADAVVEKITNVLAEKFNAQLRG